MPGVGSQGPYHGKVFRRGSCHRPAQLIIAEIESVQTSCGYGVPLYQFQEDRP